LAPPDELAALRNSLSGIGLYALTFLEKFEAEWNDKINGLRKGSHVFSIEGKLELPSQLADAVREMRQLKTIP
jgi:hypothetical protein